jgi:hypothetical protein
VVPADDDEGAGAGEVPGEDGVRMRRGAMSGEIVYFPTNDDVMWNVVLDVTIMMMTENPKYIQ